MLIGLYFFYLQVQGGVVMKRKFVLASIPILAVLLFGVVFIKYSLLDVYDNENGAIKHNGVIYLADEEINKKIVDGDLVIEQEKLIGKTDDSRFFGFKTMIYKIKGLDEKQSIWLKGMMHNGVYSSKME